MTPRSSLRGCSERTQLVHARKVLSLVLSSGRRHPWELRPKGKDHSRLRPICPTRTRPIDAQKTHVELKSPSGVEMQQKKNGSGKIGKSLTYSYMRIY